MIKKVIAALRQNEFLVLLFCISLAVFTYPLIVMTGNPDRSAPILLSIFIPWAVIILILFLVSHSYPPITDEPPPIPSGDSAEPAETSEVNHV